MNDHSISTTDFVARREAERAMLKGRSFLRQRARVDEAVAAVEAVFCKGRKLTHEAQAGVERTMREALAGHDQAFMEEHRLDNGAAEFLSLSRYTQPDLMMSSFVPIHVVINRRRMVVDTRIGCMAFTRHLFERAVQRDMAEWHGGLTEVDRAVQAATGLAIVWFDAHRKGLLPDDGMAAPFGSGLLLGHAVLWPVRRLTGRHQVIGRDAHSKMPLPPSPLLVSDSGNEAYFCRFATTINEDLMRIEQIDLRDALQAFMFRYAEALDAVVRATLWPDVVGAPCLSTSEVEDVMSVLAEELGRTVRRLAFGVQNVPIDDAALRP